MNKETQLIEWGSFTAKQLEVIKKKQGDYANDSEVLNNFKSAAANAGIKEEQQVLSLIATKVARLGNLFKGNEPNFESIEDSVLDLANYAFLLHCILKDKPFHYTPNKDDVKTIFGPGKHHKGYSNKGWDVSDKAPQQQAPSYYNTPDISHMNEVINNLNTLNNLNLTYCNGQENGY
jgi:hypothetical protein